MFAATLLILTPHLQAVQMSISPVEWITKPRCIHNMENSTGNGCEQSLTTWNSMDYSYKYNVELTKPDTKEYGLQDFIFRKLEMPT